MGLRETENAIGPSEETVLATGFLPPSGRGSLERQGPHAAFIIDLHHVEWCQGDTMSQCRISLQSRTMIFLETMHYSLQKIVFF